MNKTKSTSSEYVEFVNNGNLQNIRKLRNEIIELEKIRTYPGENDQNNNIKITLISDLINSKFVLKYFLYKEHKKKMIIAIPERWNQLLSANGMDYKPILSKIAYFLYHIRKFVKEISKSTYYLKPVRLKPFRHIRNSDQKIMLHSSFNDPAIFSNNPKLFCFSNWYIRRYLQESSIFFYTCCVKAKVKNVEFSLIPVKNYLLPISFLKQIQLVKYFFVEFLKLASNPKTLAKFNYFQLSDLILTERYKLTDKTLLPSSVLMNESSGYVIPKWVKYLEENGTNVDFFNFSISDSPIIYDDQIREFFPWGFLKWDNIKVIDEYQLTFLKKNLINVPKQIEITGVPFYTDKQINLEETDDYVCLFDIRAKPEHFGISTLNELGSNSFNYQEEIIKSMLTFSDMTGIKVFYKQKRSNDVKFLSDDTFNMVSRAEKNNTFRLIDYRVSPHKLIKGSLGVVSQAFTTTSIIAKDYNKPNVIVDLSSKLRSNDPCVRGVDIVNDSETLLAWLFHKLQITKYPEISK